MPQRNSRLVGFLIFVGLWFVAMTIMTETEFVTDPRYIMLFGGLTAIILSLLEEWYVGTNIKINLPRIPPPEVLMEMEKQRNTVPHPELRQYTVVRMWIEGKAMRKAK